MKQVSDIANTYLRGEKDGPHMLQLLRQGDEQHVGETQKRDEHQQRLGGLAVPLGLHRVGRPQLGDEDLVKRRRRRRELV